MENVKPVLDRRVLVVDDNSDLAESMSAVLELLGYEVRSATSGGDALTCMESWLPQVVFLDLTMPDMSGVEVVERARAASWCESIMLVAMTGWSAGVERDRALAAGFDLFVEKPVDMDTLQTLLAPLHR